MSDKYNHKPVHPGYQTAIEVTCDFCENIFWETRYSYNRKKRHFCSMSCYAKYRRDVMPPNEQPSWRGGVSNTEAHRRWKKKNPERMAHLKVRRYARERGATGSHTPAEWEALKIKHNDLCAACKKENPLTKDHIVPLSLGGSDLIENIQPLCRSCNSRKCAKLNIYSNPELLKEA